MKNRKYLPGILFSLTGLVYILILTRYYDLGVSPDSTVYIETAENLIRNGRFTDFNGKLVTHFPPMYPMTLAALADIFHAEVLVAANYFSAATLFLSILIANLLFVHYNFGMRSIVLLNVFLLISPAFGVFLMLWSESLFIMILLILSLLMVGWIELRKPGFLIAAGILAGLLLLTRYAGMGFIAGILAFILFERGKPLPRKINSTLLFSAFTILLPAGWSIYSANHANNPTDRAFEIHLVSAGHIKGLFTTIQSWVSPASAAGALIFLLALVYIFFRLWTQKVRWRDIYADNKSRFARYMIIAYIAFLLVSISFFDFSSPMDNRMLAPVFPYCLLLTIPFFKHAQQSIRMPWLFAALTGGLLLIQGYSFAKTARQFYREGSGYTSKPWADSETIRALANTVKDITIYTNGQEILQMFLPYQNNYLQLPVKLNNVTQQVNHDYLNEMRVMYDLVKDKKAILVFLTGVDYRLYYATKKELLEIFAGCEVIEFHDGFIIE